MQLNVSPLHLSSSPLSSTLLHLSLTLFYPPLPPYTPFDPYLNHPFQLLLFTPLLLLQGIESDWIKGYEDAMLSLGVVSFPLNLVFRRGLMHALSDTGASVAQGSLVSVCVCVCVCVCEYACVFV